MGAFGEVDLGTGDLGTGDLDAEYAAIREPWAPRVVARANGQLVKLAKAEGMFVWHAHDGEDEVFLVTRGTLGIAYRDRPEVVLRAGGFHVVPRGVEHRPRAIGGEAWIVLFEPAQTAHTGAVVSGRTRSLAAQTAHLDG